MAKLSWTSPPPSTKKRRKVATSNHNDSGRTGPVVGGSGGMSSWLVKSHPTGSPKDSNRVPNTNHSLSSPSSINNETVLPINSRGERNNFGSTIHKEQVVESVDNIRLSQSDQWLEAGNSSNRHPPSSLLLSYSNTTTTLSQPQRTTQYLITNLRRRQLTGGNLHRLPPHSSTNSVYRVGLSRFLPELISLPDDTIHIPNPTTGTTESELGRPGDEGASVYSSQFAKGIQHGHLLAIGDENGSVTLVDTRRQLRKHRSPGPKKVQGWLAHSDCIMDLIWCQGDTQILTGSGDEQAYLWDVEYGTCLAQFSEHSGTIRGLASHPIDHHLFATAGRDGNIRVWDTRCSLYQSDEASNRHRSIDVISRAHVLGSTSQPKPRSSRRLSYPIKSEPTYAVTSLTFLPHHPGSLALASAGATDGTVKVWDIRQVGAHKHKPTASPVAKNTPSTIFNKRAFGISSLALDPSGCTIYATCLDNSIYALNANRISDFPHARYQAPTFRASVYTRAAPSPDGQFLAAGSVYETVQLWDLARSTTPKWGFGAYTLHGHTREVSGVTWSPNFAHGLASLSDDATVRLWRFESTLADGPLPRTTTDRVPLRTDIGFTLPPNP